MLRSDSFTSEKDPVPTVLEAEWAPGPKRCTPIIIIIIIIITVNTDFRKRPPV